MCDPGIRELFTPAIKILAEREALVRATLLKPVLPPMTDTMRHPRNLFTADELTFIKRYGLQVQAKIEEETRKR
jgi:hypothetical protein